jgi:4-amino-4-deoxy-L-arabinose transferase-like glycosyltransferase
MNLRYPDSQESLLTEKPNPRHSQTSADPCLAPLPGGGSVAWTVWRLVAAIVVGLALLWDLGGYPLIQPDEGRNAEVAREMRSTGTWLVPTLNGVPYLDKPALYFNLVGLSLALFGEREFAARLPSALFSIGTLALVLWFCQREYGRLRGVIAVIIIATSPLFVAYARTVIFDSALAFFVTASILAGYLAERGREGDRPRWYAFSSAAAAAAILTKGPVGLIIPCLVLTTFHLWAGQREAIRRIYSARNAMIFVALVAPWVVAVSYLHPDFPYYALVDESIRRYTTNSFYRPQGWYFFIGVLLSGFLPWSIVLVEATARTWTRRARLPQIDRLWFSWLLVVLIFFSFSHSKQIGYILSAAVPVGVIAARWFDPADEDAASEVGSSVIRRSSLALAAVMLTLVVALSALGSIGEIRDRVGKLIPALVPDLAPRIGIVELGLCLVVGLVLIAVRSQSRRLAFGAFVASPLLLAALWFEPWSRIAEERSSRELAAAVDALAARADVACVWCFPTALPFYLGRTITMVSARGGELTSNYFLYSLEQGHEWPETLIRDRDAEGWLSARRRPVFLLAPARHGGETRLRALVEARGVRVQEVIPGFVGALIPAGPNP